MRPIDAVQVLNDINWHHKPTPVSEFESGFNRGLNQAMWFITHAPTITPQNEWVSVDERLPDFDVPVLVYVKDIFDNKSIINITKYTITYDLTNNWLGYENSSFKITHWMPLPAPPNSRPPEEENT